LGEGEYRVSTIVITMLSMCTSVSVLQSCQMIVHDAFLLSCLTIICKQEPSVYAFAVVSALQVPRCTKALSRCSFAKHGVARSDADATLSLYTTIDSGTLLV
jgi:hypothetical protein